MHPLSTALFLLGYGLALPTGARWRHVVRSGNSLALWGHQLGVLISLLGWLIKGRMPMVLLHIVWLVGAKIWFSLASPTQHSVDPS